MKKQKITKIQGFLEYLDLTYPKIRDNEINLVYEGRITHQITTAFTTLTEERMEQQEESKKVQRRVFHVMVECMQNINKHSESEFVVNEKFTNSSRGIILVSKGDDFYVVVTGNYIQNKNVEELDSLLTLINSLDKDGLKALYKKTIKDSSLSEKGGAGLGFIDIAKKTGNKLDYEFIKVDDKVSFFINKATVLR